MATTEKRALVIALMLATFLGALDITVVSIAAPRIAEQLSGFSLISLLFSVYMITSSVTIPLYGKLADLFGRKRVLMAGIAIFLLGSLLCGIAVNMLMLIAARAVQGSGTGAIFTLANTIAADVFPLKERSRVMGIIGSVWGVSSIIGPFIGGLFVDLFTWHWIFLINVPLAAIAMLILGLVYRENYERRRGRFDLGGALALTIAIVALLVCFNSLGSVSTGESMGEGEVGYGEGAGIIVPGAAALIAACALAAFVPLEKRAPEPIIPRHINNKTTIPVNALASVAAAIMMSASIYLPIYLQDVLGFGATLSGLALLPQTAAWLVMSFSLGGLLIRFGARRLIIATSALSLLNCASFCLLSAQLPPIGAIVIISLYGFGMGGVMTATLLVIQESVGPEDRGAAVGQNLMLKAVGQAIGAGLIGSIFNNGMLSTLARNGVTGVNLANPRAQVGQVPGFTDELLVNAFSHGLLLAFVGMTVMAVLVLVGSFLIPRKSSRKSSQEDSQKDRHDT